MSGRALFFGLALSLPLWGGLFVAAQLVRAYAR